MPTRRFLYFGFATFGLCAAVAFMTFSHLGFDGGTVLRADFLGFTGNDVILFGGLGFGLGICAIGALSLGFDLFREGWTGLRLDGLASYIVLAFAATSLSGLLFANLMSASLFASGVGFLALLGIVALYGITFMGSFGGSTGHRAQWRKGIGAAA